MKLHVHIAQGTVLNLMLASGHVNIIINKPTTLRLWKAPQSKRTYTNLQQFANHLLSCTQIHTVYSVQCTITYSTHYMYMCHCIRVEQNITKLQIHIHVHVHVRHRSLVLMDQSQRAGRKGKSAKSAKRNAFIFCHFGKFFILIV